MSEHVLLWVVLIKQTTNCLIWVVGFTRIVYTPLTYTINPRISF